MKCFSYCSILCFATLQVRAANLTISLEGTEPVTQKTVHFRCDGHAPALGLPPAAFSVQYFNGNGNNLAVLPIKGQSLIFSNVLSASGARYAAGAYIWWDAGSRGIHLYANPDSITGKQQTSCKQID